MKTTARQGIATLGMLGLLACGSQSTNFPPGAALFVNPSSLTYTGDAGPGGAVDPNLAAYVSTSQTATIDLEDHGQSPLLIQKVTLTDPTGGFMLVPPTPGGGPDGGALTGLNPFPETPAQAFVQFYFTPTTVGPYSATITITYCAGPSPDGGCTSDKVANGGTTTIPITGLGVSADAGQFNPPDGGM